MGDFSCFGYAYRDLNVQRGWFNPKAVPSYQDRISFIPNFNGGVYYIRKTEKSQQVFSLAKKFAANYSTVVFNGFSTAADEPVLALAMAVSGFEPLDSPEILFAPHSRALRIDPLAPSVSYRQKDCLISRHIIHWSNYLTLKSRYLFEVERLRNLENQDSVKYKLLYDFRVRRFFLLPKDIQAAWARLRKYYRKTGSFRAVAKKLSLLLFHR